MTVIRQSRAQRDGLMGALVAIFVFAAVGGSISAKTTGGRVAALLLLGAAALILLIGWIRLIRRPSHIEVSAEAVTHVGPDGERATLHRQWGNELMVVATGGGRSRSRRLTIAGSPVVLSLDWFSLNMVKRSCIEKGWTFAGG